MKNNWTPAQQDAIQARRGTVLVSAAAGSGKTAVLVERVLQHICDPEHPVDADRLLIVTFTKAAAAEMKERLSQRLTSLLEANPENLRLRRQQQLLSRAQISTIHSFCSRIVQNHFYKLGLPPSYQIAEESQMTLLREQAVGDVLNEGYESGGDAFLDLVEAFCSDRDDRHLADVILQVYDFTRAHPFPERWLRDTADYYKSGQSVEETVWGQELSEYIRDTVSHCAALTQTALALLSEDEKLDKAYRPALDSDLAMLRHFTELWETGTWDQRVTAIQERKFARLGSVRGYTDDPLALRIKSLRQQVKDLLEKKVAPKLFSEADCQVDLNRQGTLLETLFRLVTNFSKRLDELKRDRQLADFSDLEHWALDLLWEEIDGVYHPTAEARELAQQFDEIIVDEYQDTNEAQDQIFRAVSKDETNLFLVGDVKQSIYGFRQAMPQIFLKRRANYQPYDREKDAYPATITLDRNFRSRKTVTDAVNTCFAQLMSEGAGDVEYDEREALAPGAIYEEQAGTEMELLILEGDAVDDDTLDEDMAVLEAREIARRIHSLISSGFLVKDGETRRPVTYGDCAILLRSANRHMAKYVRELQQWGVPAKSGKNPGFFQTAEIAVMTSFLRVISNPVQDIPLVSVLMSPIYGFTPDELAEIRSADKKAPLYLALQQAAERGMERAKLFLAELSDYRTLAATLPADRLLNVVYEKTGYCSLVQAMENGQGRLANLQLLLEYAAKLEGSGHHGVAGFVRFLDRLQAQGGDLTAAQVTQDGQNAVEIMSIHNSKGLEFPVCIVAGCSRRFRRTRDDALIHPRLGLGVKLRDEKLPCKYTTLMREAISIACDRESMAEELRILYVAMTRAREKLILLTTEKKLDTKLSTLASGLSKEEKLDPYVVNNASSFSDWLLTCALRHPNGIELRERAGVEVPVICGKYTSFWRVETLLPSPASEPLLLVSEEVAPPDPEFLEVLRARFAYRYPHEHALNLPSKVTASALAEESARPWDASVRTLPRPSFLSQKGLTPAERGTATHAFLQFCDFKSAQENSELEVQRLVSHGFLTKEEGEAVDLRHVSSFFETSIYKRMEQAEQLYREYRFTAEIPASLVQPDAVGEEVVVLQGAVDCAFVENGELVIVDYKTDRGSDEAALWARYEKQLSLYAMALEQCFDLPVKETLLYSFALGKAVGKK